MNILQLITWMVLATSISTVYSNRQYFLLSGNDILSALVGWSRSWNKNSTWPFCAKLIALVWCKTHQRQIPWDKGCTWGKEVADRDSSAEVVVQSFLPVSPSILPCGRSEVYGQCTLAPHTACVQPMTVAPYTQQSKSKVIKHTHRQGREHAVTDEIASLLPLPEKTCLMFSERTGDSGARIKNIAVNTASVQRPKYISE